MLAGEAGADIMVAGAGNDFIAIGGGDTATGGEGQDIFALDTRELRGDVIKDFNPETDSITAVYTGAAPDFDIVLQEVTGGVNVIFDFHVPSDPNTMITLEGVTAADLADTTIATMAAADYLEQVYAARDTALATVV